MLGIKSSYIPNAKADMRFKRNLYQRGREIESRLLELEHRRGRQ